ncbi:MAG: DUF3267 domain-containing protein [Agitococcus sp.]|nr:DUF3267 domain-containing protein [Agitococcus sp.]MDO9178614.1 DUF3267 domain-containing protein [Agitococcus sp.]
MKFRYGPPPAINLEINAPLALTFHSLGKMSLYGIAVGALAIVIATGGMWQLVLTQLTYTLAHQPPLVFIGSLLFTLFLHELMHLLVLPHPFFGDRNVIGVLPSVGLLYAWCGYPMSKARAILGGLAPFFILGILPLALLPFFPEVIGTLLPSVLLNILGAGADILVCYQIIRQVPAESVIQITAGDIYFGDIATP